MELSTFYDAWKTQDTGGYSYTVDIPGSETREPGVHASELGCLLRVVYSLLGVERRPATDTDAKRTNMKMRFNIGHAVHAMLQHELKLMCEWLVGDVQFQDEVRVNPEIGGPAAQYLMRSSCDGIFTFYPPREDYTVNVPAYLRVGLEIKTASEKEFDKLVKPKDEHREQTCLYMKALNLPLMWTLYYNKSNSNYTKSSPPFLFQFDHALWTSKLEPRIQSAHQFAQAKQLPPREEGFYCRWCPFAWTCNPPSANRKYGPTSAVHNPGALKV